MAAFRHGETRRGEESPGSMEARCRVTPGGGDPRESATESKPPVRLYAPPARVKGCGKSAPRPRRRGRHGKPHREQDRIGAAGRDSSELPAGGFPRRRPGRSREASGNGRPRRMAIHRSSERGQDPAYRPSGALSLHSTPASGMATGSRHRIFDPMPVALAGPCQPHPPRQEVQPHTPGFSKSFGARYPTVVHSAKIWGQARIIVLLAARR